MKKRFTAKNPKEDSITEHEKPPATSANGTRHLTAAKAYELYEQRGRIDGHALEDWLKAEASVTGTTE